MIGWREGERKYGIPYLRHWPCVFAIAILRDLLFSELQKSLMAVLASQPVPATHTIPSWSCDPSTCAIHRSSTWITLISKSPGRVLDTHKRQVTHHLYRAFCGLDPPPDRLNTNSKDFSKLPNSQKARSSEDDWHNHFSIFSITIVLAN